MTIDCHRCIHYYVTWDVHYPHGCRAMGFKTPRYPIDVVRSAMQGRDCLSYEEIRREKHPRSSKTASRRVRSR